jgi:PAS domain-containing protein
MRDSSELRMYRLIFEHCPQALVVVDDDGRVLLHNRRARTLADLDLEALFRSHDADVQAFRAKLRVGWHATCDVKVQGPTGIRRLSLEGRAHESFSVVSVREVLR